MKRVLRIGTRDSQLAVWQATLVKDELAKHHVESELVYIKSEGDIDLATPLYEIGVQGVFTRTLDAALLGNKIDVAVHSMKDVPTQLAQGITQAAVLKRASYKDIFVFKGEASVINSELGFLEGQWSGGDHTSSPRNVSRFTIATSSIRRKAQWLHRYPDHIVENLRGNVNTRLKKVRESNWKGAIFAAAGLERIHLRPEHSIELDWMLPAPAQGAIMVVCRAEDDGAKEPCNILNDEATALCTKIERDFLRTLMGGCSTPISALAVVEDGDVYFRGNIFSLDGKEHAGTASRSEIRYAATLGVDAAKEVLSDGGKQIAEAIRNAGK
jgi:hydroxymethylbilane synthase